MSYLKNTTINHHNILDDKDLQLILISKQALTSITCDCLTQYKSQQKQIFTSLLRCLHGLRRSDLLLLHIDRCRHVVCFADYASMPMPFRISRPAFHWLFSFRFSTQTVIFVMLVTLIN